MNLSIDIGIERNRRCLGLELWLAKNLKILEIVDLCVMVPSEYWFCCCQNMLLIVEGIWCSDWALVVRLLVNCF